MEKFHPRSFNLGVSKRAFDAIGGFRDMRFGEDIDYLRLIENGFSTTLISDAYVYHKRRTNFRKFSNRCIIRNCPHQSISASSSIIETGASVAFDFCSGNDCVVGTFRFLSHFSDYSSCVLFVDFY